MAHVKVVRRSMRPEEWTDLRFVWLQRGIYEEKFEITDLEIRDARQISEDQYEYYSDEYRPLKKDDMYFTPEIHPGILHSCHKRAKFFCR